MGNKAVEDAPPVRLGYLLSLDLMEHAPVLLRVSAQAVSEKALDELFFEKVKQPWRECMVPVEPYKRSSDQSVLGNMEDILEQLYKVLREERLQLSHEPAPCAGRLTSKPQSVT